MDPLTALGPFCGAEALAARLGISRQALDDMVEARQVLAVPTDGGEQAFPAWQFEPDGHVLPGLPEVLRVLLPTIDELTAAIWLATPSERLGGAAAADALRTDGVDAVLEAARADAARWTS